MPKHKKRKEAQSGGTSGECCPLVNAVGVGKLPDMINKRTPKYRIAVWLQENYELNPTKCLLRESVYEHYTQFSKEAGLVVENQAVLGKVMAEVFKAVKMRRLGGRKQSRYYYWGLDVRNNSSFHRKLRKKSRESFPNQKVVALSKMVHHQESTPPIVVPLEPTPRRHVTIPCKLIGEIVLGQPAKTLSPLEDIPSAQLSSTSENMYVVPSSESKRTKDTFSELVERTLTHSEAFEAVEASPPAHVTENTGSPSVSGSLAMNDTIQLSTSDMSATAGSESRLSSSSGNDVDTSDDVMDIASSHAFLEGGHGDQPVAYLELPSGEQTENYFQNGAAMLELNSPLAEGATEPIGYEHFMVENHPTTWRRLSNMDKKCNTELALTWLDEEYEMNPQCCLSRQTVYEHYIEFCDKFSLIPATQAIFGRIIQRAFPRLEMRRLGRRGASRYYYMGIDIREESASYDMVTKAKIVNSRGKPKLSRAFNGEPRKLRNDKR